MTAGAKPDPVVQAIVATLYIKISISLSYWSPLSWICGRSISNASRTGTALVCPTLARTEGFWWHSGRRCNCKPSAELSLISVTTPNRQTRTNTFVRSNSVEPRFLECCPRAAQIFILARPTLILFSFILFGLVADTAIGIAFMAGSGKNSCPIFPAGSVGFAPLRLVTYFSA